MKATWGLVCLLALTPQVFYLGSRSPFLLTKALYLYLLGALACLLLVLDWRRRTPTGLPPGLLAPLLFVAYAALRGPWGPGPRPEIAAPFLWGTLLLVAWPTAAAVQGHPRSRARYARLLVLLGGLTACYALLQTLGVDLPMYRPGTRVLSATFSVGAGHPPFATLGNPNFLAEYMAALLPLAVAGAMAGAGNSGWVMGGAAILIAATLPLTLARGAWIGTAAGLAAMCLLQPRPGARARRAVVLGLLVLVSSLLAAASVEHFSGSTGPWRKALGTISQVTSGGEGRRLWWSATALMVADHPVTGMGEGRFRETYPPYQARVLASLEDRERKAVPASPVESPHNDYLQVAAELGIPGLLLLLGALGLIVRDAARAVRRAEGPDRAVRAGCMGGLVAVLVAALFGYPLHTASGLFVASALSALALATGPGEEPTGPPRRWQWILLVAVTALGFLQATHLLQVYAASVHLHRGTELLLRRDLPGAIEALERAHQVSPRDSEVRVSLGQAYLAAGRPDVALPHLQAGLHGFDSAPLRSILGRTYMALGQFGAAEEVLRVGVTSFPGYAPLHANYGAFLAAQGRDGEASQELRRAVAGDPALADAQYWLGLLRDRAGDQRGARVALERFLELARPGDPRVTVAAARLRELEEASRAH